MEVSNSTGFNRVRLSRLEEGFAGAAFARVARIAYRTLKEVEDGNPNVRLDTKHKIVRGFNSLPNKLRNYTFDYLFPNG